MVHSLVEATGAEVRQHWLYGDQYPLYTCELAGHRVSIAHLPVGAPGTVMLMEEMIACGARTFLGFGMAGSLQPSAPVGTCFIPLACIREEGTSSHYIERDIVVVPSPRLVALLEHAGRQEQVDIRSGPHWTTDAPYRELISKIEAYGRQGVLGVDMETSAMYALGQVRYVDVCNLLVVSDELSHEWRPAFGQTELLQALQRAQRVVLRCLTKLSATAAGNDRSA